MELDGCFHTCHAYFEIVNLVFRGRLFSCMKADEARSSVLKVCTSEIHTRSKFLRVYNCMFMYYLKNEQECFIRFKATSAQREWL